jgi:L-lactate dehydrogenase complex protein LldG
MPQKTNAELIGMFIQSAINISATAEKITASPECLNNALLAKCGKDEAVMLALPEGYAENLFSLFLRNKNVITNPSADQLKTIRTGVTFSFAAVASTGSVCLSLDDNLTAPVSILTQNHITIVESNGIVTRPTNLFEGKYLNCGSFSFITGPSATADMGPLVRGVHGPGKLHIIVLE